jgi:hypothetical protein
VTLTVEVEMIVFVGPVTVLVTYIVVAATAIGGDEAKTGSTV